MSREPDFEDATSHNLPVVDATMVFDYFRNNPDFQDPEVRNVKTTKATRPSYGDDAIGYVQVKRSNNLCLVKAKVTPEHKVRQQLYTINVTINEETRTVVQCSCHDCSASAGGCKHGIAVLLWLHRRTEEPSVTSVKCYWNKPKLAKVGSSLKFTTLKDLCQKAPPTLVEVGADFLQKVLDEGKKRGASGTLYREVVEDEKISNVCIHTLYNKFIHEDGMKSAESFLTFLKTKLTKKLCTIVERMTQKQFKTSRWYTVRYGRITASKLFEASRCKTVDGELVKNILGGCRPIKTPAIERGQKLEKLVIEEFERRYNLKVSNAGFFLSSDFPIFGASPDGLTLTHVIEVKCPLKEETVKNYIVDDAIASKPFAQMQLQMLLTKKKQGYFVVASPNFEETKNFQVLEVELDEQYLKEIMHKSEIFWREAIYTKL